MSRKKASKRTATRIKTSPAATRPKMSRARRVLAGFCLGLVLLASAGIFAARRSSRRAPGPQQVQPQTSQVTPQSSSPSKQYVYAGGKLIATVEGTSSTPPPPPGGIVLNADAIPGQVILAWTYSGSGQDSFNVKRAAGTPNDPNSPAFIPAGTTGPTGSTFTDDNSHNGLSPGTYQYIVVAHSNTAGDSPPSNIVTVTLPTGPPAAPSGMTAAYNPNGPEVDLSWIRNSTNETGFKLERAPSGGSFSQIAVLCAGPSSTTYVDKPVSGPVGYTYQVKAYNADGDSAYSTSSMVKVPAPAPVASMVSCGTSVQISWTESVVVDTFTVFRNGTQIALNIPPTPPTTAPSTTTFTDSSAPSQTPLSYTVVAHSNNYGDSAQSNPVTCTTPAGCQVTTFSGNGTYAYLEGQGTAAEWADPQGETVAIDPVSSNYALFLCDTDDQRIRMVYLQGPNQGLSVHIAGSGTQGWSGGHGDAMNARFSNPRGITAITNSTGVVTALIVADSDNSVIRELTPPATAGADWGITDLSGQGGGLPGYLDGAGSVALFNSPQDVAIGTDGFIYVADASNSAVRRVDLQGNTITIANVNSGLGFVTGITVSKTSGLLYVADQSNGAIWQVSTVGTTSSIASSLTKPYHLAWATGDVLYIANRVAQQIVRLPISSSWSPYAGTGVQSFSDGACITIAQFNMPRGVAMGPQGEIYITDSGNNRIRKIQ